jgi:hypothetical protein
LEHVSGFSVTTAKVTILEPPARGILTHTGLHEPCGSTPRR